MCRAERWAGEVASMMPDGDTVCDSLAARDGRFEGMALVCVRTTGIFCRMTCPARTAKRENVRFRASAAECRAAGFRACKRCKPEQSGPEQSRPDQAGSPFAGSSSVTVS